MSDSFQPHGLNSPGNSPVQNNGMGNLSLFQGSFPTQRSNPGLSYCRQILYHLSHKGSPRILEWVASPFSSESSPPRNRTGVYRIAGRFFINWAIREAQWTYLQNQNRVIEVENKLMVTRMGKWGRDKLRDLDWHIHATIYKIDNNKDYYIA